MSEKTYYKITGMSENFRKFDEQTKASQTIAEQMEIWNLRFMLAIAQQLSIISGHLGTIVAKAKEQPKQEE